MNPRSRYLALLLSLSLFSLASADDAAEDIHGVSWHVSQTFLEAYKVYGARMRTRASLSACDLKNLAESLAVSDAEHVLIVTDYLDKNTDVPAAASDLLTGLLSMTLAYEFGYGEATKISFKMMKQAGP